MHGSRWFRSAVDPVPKSWVECRAVGVLRVRGRAISALSAHAIAGRGNIVTADPYDALRELARLKNEGVLTEKDFETQKARILATIAPPSASPYSARPTDEAQPQDTHRRDSAQESSTDHHPTWGELVESEEMEAVLKFNLAYYREQFREILRRTGVKDRYTSNSQSISAIVGSRTWNWAALFFGPLWAAYRGIYLWALIVGAACVLILGDRALGGLSLIGPFAVSLICAWLGNGALLARLGKEATQTADHGVPFRQPSPSFGRVIVAIFAILFAAIVALAVESPAIVDYTRDNLARAFPAIGNMVHASRNNQLAKVTQCDASAYDDYDGPHHVITAGTLVVLLNHGAIRTQQQTRTTMKYLHFYRVIGPNAEPAWMQTEAFEPGCHDMVKPNHQAHSH